MEDNNINGSRDVLELISYNHIDDSIIAELTDNDATKNQIRLFLLAQAKRELMRTVRLMNFLNKVEDAYEQKVDAAMDNMTLSQYQNVIETISLCLSRSNDIIQKVMKDDTLANILIFNQDNSNNVTNNTTNIGLQSAESRSKVLKVVDSIINKISDVENSDSPQE